MKIVAGDILTFHENYYIAHQCNCKSSYAKGLAEKIFNKFPNSNVYNDNSVREVGKIIVRDKIINMFSQKYPSKPTQYETSLYRSILFKECLNEIIQTFPNGIPIAFPYGIGCGLAGGDWDNYYNMIEEFSNNNKNFDIIIVKFD